MSEYSKVTCVKHGEQIEKSKVTCVKHGEQIEGLDRVQGNGSAPHPQSACKHRLGNPS
jgi:hypothetical protein